MGYILGDSEVVFKNIGLYCGLHCSSGALKASWADGISPTKSAGGDPAACICIMLVK